MKRDELAFGPTDGRASLRVLHIEPAAGLDEDFQDVVPSLVRGAHHGEPGFIRGIHVQAELEAQLYRGIDDSRDSTNDCCTATFPPAAVTSAVVPPRS